ncbi:MAG: 23S rRNA (uracil(1939)-C(5))-methyltransferase RlmD [Deltaproteobacteria bacterium]|nr:23S rRNA (uracil(1939)-C(5))-methyltransferase RlmD [Deltaproteobacteria bacterium]
MRKEPMTSRAAPPGRPSRSRSLLRAGDSHSMLVEAYDQDGLAVGQVHGVEVHVPGAVASEEVTVRIDHVSRHKPVVWATLVSVERPAAARVAPRCPMAGRCGGCPWMHIEYEEQLAAKRARIEPVAAGLGQAASAVVVDASPSLFRYRNRGKYVPARRGRKLILGAYEPRSHRVIETLGCLAVEPAVDQTVRALVDVLSGVPIRLYNEQTRKGDLRYVGIRANHRGQVLATMVLAEEPSWDLKEAVDRFSGACPELVGVTVDVNRTEGNVIFSGAASALVGQAWIEERFGSVAVRLSGHGFAQVNREQATRLYEHVADRAARPLGTRQVERVWELFSGPGALSMTMAHRGLSVLGIERDAQSVQSARRAAEAQGLSCRFIEADANQALVKGIVDEPAPDVVVLNPPRSGCRPELLLGIGRARIGRVIYVSCNPTTLARDLIVLADFGYFLTDLQGFDLMPHTPHVETVAVMSHRSAFRRSEPGASRGLGA